MCRNRILVRLMKNLREVEMNFLGEILGERKNCVLTKHLKEFSSGVVLIAIILIV